jgi:ubiquinone/menaquinone biosynthesis C-methylase UbiE
MNELPPTSPTVSACTLSSMLDTLGRIINDGPDEIGATPEAVKSCCAEVYGLDLVGAFLGDSYHPGGAALTRRLADAMDLRPGQAVLDVACGIGTTAVLLAQERAVKMTGVDLGVLQVDQARAEARQLGLDDVTRFEVGDAERLPVPDESFDAVICECALCTFPDKRTAADEMARVLLPSGKVGITDICLEPDRLDPDLAGIAGRVACLADAQPITVTADLFVSCGFRVTTIERQDRALAETIEQIQATLTALKIVGLPVLDSKLLRRSISLAAKAADVVARGDAGYVLLVAERTG